MLPCPRKCTTSFFQDFYELVLALHINSRSKKVCEKLKMDVELGLELAKCLDEFVSGSPIFISGETDSMFILTAVLKGTDISVVRTYSFSNYFRI